MRKLKWLLMSITLLLSSISLSATGAATASAQQRVTARQAQAMGLPVDRLIIKFKTTTATGNPAEADMRAAASQPLAALSSVAGQALVYDRALSGDAAVLKLPEKMTEADAAAVAQKLMTQAATLGIEYVEPDAIRQVLLAPNDPFYAEQWDDQAVASGDSYGINLPGAWDITTGSSSVVVAVVDTGIRFNHPDLAGRTVAGYDFISEAPVANDGDGPDNDPSDPGDWLTSAEARSSYFRGCTTTPSSWHGSHVAGTIGAIGNNGAGVTGIDWQAKLLPVRVLGKCGGLVSDIVDGMRWAAGIDILNVPHNNNPARVINLSLGGTGACSAAEQSAINDVTSRGVVVVVAAGNDHQDAANSSPANCANVISVAATNRAGNRASYSDYGNVITISAPGGESESNQGDAILSTVDSGTRGPQGPDYAYYVGTSMAAPHVAGVVSLMFSINPALLPAQVLAFLQSTATGFPAGSSCNTALCGAGIANAAAAVSAVSNAVGATPTPTPVPTLEPTLTPTFVPTADPTGSTNLTQTAYLPIIAVP